MTKDSTCSSMHRFLRKCTKLITYQPSSKFIAIILLIATIFLISGGVYILFTPTEIFLQYRGTLRMIYPSLYEQTLAESVAVILIYVLGAIGLMLIYRSIKYRYNPSRASLLINAGIALLIIAFIMIELIFLQKLGIF